MKFFKHLGLFAELAYIVSAIGVILIEHNPTIWDFRLWVGLSIVWVGGCFMRDLICNGK